MPSFNVISKLGKQNVKPNTMPPITWASIVLGNCLEAYGGPYLFGALGTADAMYAPVVTRFLTYDVQLDEVSAAYCQTIMALPEMQASIEAARQEPDEIDPLEVEF